MKRARADTAPCDDRGWLPGVEAAEDQARPGLGPEERGLLGQASARVGGRRDLGDARRAEQERGVGLALLDRADRLVRVRLVGELVPWQRGDDGVDARGVEL